MKRISCALIVLAYLVAVALWARHADLPLQSAAAIEADSYHNVLGGDTDTWVVHWTAK